MEPDNDTNTSSGTSQCGEMVTTSSSETTLLTTPSSTVAVSKSTTTGAKRVPGRRAQYTKYLESKVDELEAQLAERQRQMSRMTGAVPVILLSTTESNILSEHDRSFPLLSPPHEMPSNGQLRLDLVDVFFEDTPIYFSAIDKTWFLQNPQYHSPFVLNAMYALALAAGYRSGRFDTSLGDLFYHQAQQTMSDALHNSNRVVAMALTWMSSYSACKGILEVPGKLSLFNLAKLLVHLVTNKPGKTNIYIAMAYRLIESLKLNSEYPHIRPRIAVNLEQEMNRRLVMAVFEKDCYSSYGFQLPSVASGPPEIGVPLYSMFGVDSTDPANRFTYVAYNHLHAARFSLFALFFNIIRMVRLPAENMSVYTRNTSLSFSDFDWELRNWFRCLPPHLQLRPGIVFSDSRTTFDMDRPPWTLLYLHTLAHYLVVILHARRFKIAIGKSPGVEPDEQVLASYELSLNSATRICEFVQIIMDQGNQFQAISTFIVSIMFNTGLTLVDAYESQYRAFQMGKQVPTNVLRAPSFFSTQLHCLQRALDLISRTTAIATTLGDTLRERIAASTISTSHRYEDKIITPSVKYV